MNEPSFSLLDNYKCAVLKMFNTSKNNNCIYDYCNFHSAIEISVILTGNGTVYIEDKCCDFYSNDVLIFAPNEKHCFKIDENTEILTLHIEPQYIWSSNDLTNVSLLNPFFYKSKKFKNRIPFGSQIAKNIFLSIQNIQKEFENKYSEYEFGIKLEVLDIFLLIFREFGFSSKNAKILSQYRKTNNFEKSMFFINSSVYTDTDLYFISNKAYMSRSHFCTVFKKYNGLTLWDYITIKRIEKAIELLTTTSMTNINIALECGFNNSANYYRAFKKITGKTPGNFK